MIETEFSIRAVPMVEVDGAANIPTVVYFTKRGTVEIGQAAIKMSIEDGRRINQDFKVDLGNTAPGSVSRARFPTATGERRSAAELTGEFLNTLIQKIRTWSQNKNLSIAPGILISEPLPSQQSQNWLVNYRANIKRILQGKGFAPKSIDFLPEPFAAFQYYRYGERHPELQQRVRHRVLVVDFGGGTFDCCGIETTKEGDISYSGQNQRPLAARSEPVGGFLVDRFIAERLVEKTIPKSSMGFLRKGLDAYSKFRKGEQDPEMLDSRYRQFIDSFHQLIYASEGIKLRLVSTIEEWGLEAQLTQSVSARWIIDPFASPSEWTEASFSAAEFRDLFIRRIWRERLRAVVEDVIRSIKAETGGAPLDFVLLSGGSANIRWLRELLVQDFGHEVELDRVLKLDNYQEVVSKGLAIESARRFYSPEGDFGNVTYNPLLLSLSADVIATSPVRYRSEHFPEVREVPGLLIPVGTNLKEYGGKDLRWKFRLPKPPKHRLDYFFFRAATVQQELSLGKPFDPDLHGAHIQNVEEHSIFTPKHFNRFDANLQLQLSLRDDGTATPTFHYAVSRDPAGCLSVEGRPFYLDSAPIAAGPKPKAYLGLDFGTSNSSISFVDHQKVETYKLRKGDYSWKEINDLIARLPFPLSVPLAKYLSETDPRLLVKPLLDFVEAALALGSYLAYQEMRILGGNTRIFKGFTQRSAGPLWGFLKAVLQQLGKKALYARPYNELFDPKHEMEKFVNDLAQLKHEKKSIADVLHFPKVSLLANISDRVFGSSMDFGYFQDVRKERFARSYAGNFRVAHGDGYFVRTHRYQGQESYADYQSFAVSENGIAIPLEPLMLWDYCPSHPSEERPHLYVFDLADKGNSKFEFKAIGYPCTTTVESGGRASEIALALARLKVADEPLIVTNVQFQRSE